VSVIGFRNVRQNLIVDCPRKHHTLLHILPFDEREGEEEPPAQVGSSVCLSVVKSPSPHPSNAVDLGTALVHMRDRSSSVLTMRALVDSASQVSIITAACVK